MLKSYSKINIFLLVKSKKENERLHKIDSLFYKNKNLYDEIFIQENKKNKDNIEYFIKDKKIIIKNCLINKILNLLRDNKIISNFYDIKINKNIPIGSGLGGGSSNAATVFKYFYPNNKVDKKIKSELLKISSDLFFFLYDYDYARVYNYGEKIKKVKIKKDINIELFFTNISCETKKVYMKFDELNNNENIKTSYKKEFKKFKNKNYNLLVNDLKKPCFLIYKKMNDFYLLNEKKHNNFLLSGSGSTFFKIKED